MEKMQRIKVDKDKCEVIVSFNTTLYTQEHIDKAIEDFLDSCTISRVGGSIVLAPKDRKDLEIVGYEFYNYVLGLMKTQ